MEIERMREGKCKRCGEKWDPKHRSTKRNETKNLYNCEANNDSNNDESDAVTPKLDDGSITQMSLSAMTGISQPHTLKLKGHIKKKNVMVLLDIGSTHNFLGSTMAKRLNIFTFPMPNMKVMVADGKENEKVGKCHKVKLQIQNFNLESPFYTVPLRGVDVVLGIQWLQTLGTYSANHQKQFIRFKWEG